MAMENPSSSSPAVSIDETSQTSQTSQYCGECRCEVPNVVASDEESDEWSSSSASEEEHSEETSESINNASSQTVQESASLEMDDTTSATSKDVEADKSESTSSETATEENPETENLSDSTNDSTCCSSCRSGKVVFSMVEVREFPIIPGDNPSVTAGCPLAIAWDHDKEMSCSVDDYESGKPHSRIMAQLRKPSMHREALLKDCGYSRKEIQDATKVANIGRNQRQRTLETMKLTPILYMMEKVKRKIKGAKRKEKNLLEQVLTSVPPPVTKPLLKQEDVLRWSIETAPMDSSVDSL